MLGARTGVEVVVKHEKPRADRRFQGARSSMGVMRPLRWLPERNALKRHHEIPIR